MEHNKSDFIIVYNGEERRKLGIPECQIPMLTFNNVCSSYQVLNYVPSYMQHFKL